MFGDFGGCSPYIDGELIVAKEHKRLADSAQMKIPYMIGSTSEDVVPPLPLFYGKDLINLK